jgi:trehalose/maltose transport system substrate-binding protein
MRISPAVTSTAVLALLLSAGCATGAPSRAVLPGGAGPAFSTIEWLASSITQTVNDDPRQVLIDAFERAYPSIRVDLVAGPTSTDVERSTLISEMSAGSATPDVYLGDVIWPYELAKRGLALPLNHYLPASFWTQFGSPAKHSVNSLVKAATYRRDIYAVPFFVDEGFLYYRKDLLKRVGVTEAPKTWEELVQDAKQLKKKRLPYQFVWQGNDYEGLTCDWTEFLADAWGGQPSGQPVGASLAAELDSPQALRALNFMRSLLHGGISPAGTTGTTTYEEPEADSMFDSGKAAFLRGWDASYADALGSGSAVAGHGGSMVGVAPPPDFKGQGSPGWSVIGGWDLYVNPHTRHLTADLTFITWLAGPQAQRILASQYDEIPANYRVRADRSVIGQNPVLQAAAQTRLVSRPAATTDYQTITTAIHRNIHAALIAPPSATQAACMALVRAARAVDPGFRGVLRCAANAGAGG